MEPNENRLIVLVNLLTDALYPNPEDPGPVGPWGPWIREASAKAALAGLAGHVDDRDHPFGGRWPHPNWAWIVAAMRDLASLNPQPLPPRDPGIVFARNLADVAIRRAREVGGEQGGSTLRRFAEDWCGTVSHFLPPKPGDPGEPRPPRPEESLVLGAALVRASASIDVPALKQAAEEAGRKIFDHGLAGMA
ncbi:MAG: hypothetical protein KIT31_41755 [Deltaproteobacteria bacterium]|nr:hypothetical protein [Deltaproteobacteria bacterium]